MLSQLALGPATRAELMTTESWSEYGKKIQTASPRLQVLIAACLYVVLGIAGPSQGFADEVATNEILQVNLNLKTLRRWKPMLMPRIL